MGHAEHRGEHENSARASDSPSREVHGDLEPEEQDMEQVTGGRDAATGLPTGKRMYKP